MSVGLATRSASTPRIGEHRGRVGDGGARGSGDRGGCRGVDVDDVLEARVGVRGNVRRMDPADAAGAEEGEGLHACGAPPLCAVSWNA